LAACKTTQTTANAPDELDISIREASDYLNGRLPAGDKIAFVNIQSTSDTLSEYIINGLIENTVNDGMFPVIDRQQLDAIRAELNFQLSGEVDDNSAQSIGKILGVKTIVTGSVTQMGDLYRFTVRALAVETAQIQGQFGRNIPRGRTIVALLGGSGGSGTGTATRRTASGTSGGTAQTSAGSTAAPANGTYTFYPRLRATKAGMPVNAYIDRIIVSGGYMTVVVASTPVGRGDGFIPGGNNWWITGSAILQDLDNPRLSYNGVNRVVDELSGGNAISFQGVTGRRFSLTNNFDGDPPTVFDEIILPDQPVSSAEPTGRGSPPDQ
jgi:TolB-like protein